MVALISLKSSFETGTSCSFLSRRPVCPIWLHLNILVFPNLSIPVANPYKSSITLPCVRLVHTPNTLINSLRWRKFIFPPTRTTLFDWLPLVPNLHLILHTYPLRILFCRTHSTPLTNYLGLHSKFSLFAQLFQFCEQCFIFSSRCKCISQCLQGISSYILSNQRICNVSVKYSANGICTTKSPLLFGSIYATFAKADTRLAKAAIDSSCFFSDQNDRLFLTRNFSMTD